MRTAPQSMLQLLVEAEATAVVRAAPHERTQARTTLCNGYCDKTVTTASGDVTVRIPKTRTGSFSWALLAPRRRIYEHLQSVPGRGEDREQAGVDQSVPQQLEAPFRPPQRLGHVRTRSAVSTRPVP